MDNGISVSFSIVIATIGRPCLFKTLDDIARSSCQPCVVFIVLPKGSNFIVLDHQWRNDKLKLVTLYGDKGQVRQRGVGLSRIQSDIVIQMDDDIRFDKLMLQKLVKEVEANPSLAVAPLMFDEAGRCRVGMRMKQNRLLRALLGARSEKHCVGTGYISKLGIAVRPRIIVKEGLIASEWLPGGCMAFHKNFIIGDNEGWTPKGKFFGEDLINSISLRERGASLAFVSDAKICTKFDTNIDFNSAATHFKSLIYIQRLMSNQPRYLATALFCGFRFIYQIVKFLKR